MSENDPVAEYRTRASKELGLAGNHYDAISAFLDRYEQAVATKALHDVARLMEGRGYDDDAVNFVDTYADAWNTR
jgi:hypothetical protein